LAGTTREIKIEVEDQLTISTVLATIESQYPMLRGTIRDQITKQRRPFIRFFACGQDWSHEPVDKPLPDEIARGETQLLIVGAMAGG
jgi:molybdopterin synthase sulfur carrier subunit